MKTPELEVRITIKEVKIPREGEFENIKNAQFRRVRGDAMEFDESFKRAQAELSDIIWMQ